MVCHRVQDGCLLGGIGSISLPSLRMVALLGAFSFLTLGLGSLVPLLRSPPPPIPDQRDGPNL